MEVLRRDFLVDDLRAATTGVGITGTIVVEAERSLAETLWLSEIAANDDLIRGVVGWAPLTHPEIASELERLAQLPKLRGIRHPIHDEADDHFVLREDFNRGIATLKQFDLRYDILIFEKSSLSTGIRISFSSLTTLPSPAFATGRSRRGRKTSANWPAARTSIANSQEWLRRRTGAHGPTKVFLRILT
jgi:hypothetical protein